MKLAIIGSGNIAHDFLTITKDLKDTKLSAIVGTTRSLDILKQLQKHYQIDEIFTDYEKALVNGDFDTVYIAVPNSLHYSFAKKALEHGKNVISEKPFTVKYDEFLELKRIALEKKLVLIEAITNQYLQNYLEIKKRLPEIGNLKLIESNYSHHLPSYDDLKIGKVLPVFDCHKGGGALLDLNIYNIHFIVGLLGKPQAVSYLPNIEQGVDTSGILTLDYGTSKAVAIAANDSATPCRGTVIQGDQGTIAVNGPTNKVESFDIYDSDRNLLEKVADNIYPHRMYQEFVEFEQIIRERDLTAVKQRLEHSELVMWTVTEALKSAQLKVD